MTYPDNFVNRIINADCLEAMKLIPDKSIDLVLTDPPYGTTALEWDNVPNLKELWTEFKRIGKDTCTFIFTASQPFTTDLINSNRKWFKYELIWDKLQGRQPYLAYISPMKSHENIIIFCKNKTKYFPIMEKALLQNMRDRTKNFNTGVEKSAWGKMEPYITTKDENLRFPQSVIKISGQDSEINQNLRVHPTQKPLKLFEYLIKTYTEPNDLILDPFLGSGTTAVACKKLNRRYIGIEISPEYCKIAEQRLKQGILDF